MQLHHTGYLYRGCGLWYTVITLGLLASVYYRTLRLYMPPCSIETAPLMYTINHSLPWHNYNMYCTLYTCTYLDHRLVEMNTTEHTGWTPSLQLHRADTCTCIFVLGHENNNKLHIQYASKKTSHKRTVQRDARSRSAPVQAPCTPRSAPVQAPFAIIGSPVRVFVRFSRFLNC